MIYLVVYDITENDLRNRVIEICKNRGLKRIQKSVFFGELTEEQLKNLNKLLSEIEMELESNSVIVFSLCKSCVDSIHFYGRKFDQNDYKKKRLVYID